MTYDELVAISKAYADREDIDVAANIDRFILFAEARMNRILKTREQSARVLIPIVLNQTEYDLPADFRGFRNFRLRVGTDPDFGYHQYHYLGPEPFNARINRPFNDSVPASTSVTNPSASQHYFSIQANQIVIHPPETDPDFMLDLLYWQKVPNLNSTDDNNWMSFENPDIYLAGITAEIELFVKHFDVSQIWYNRMGTAMEELKLSSDLEVWSGSLLETRTDF